MKQFVLASLTAVLLCFVSTWLFSDPIETWAQVCDNCQVPQQTVTKADKLLNLTDEEKTEAEERHLLGGQPVPASTATNEHMIHNTSG